jgi:hypothetical protein
MIVPIRVEYVDGSTDEVDTSAVSVVNMERRFNLGVVGLFALPTARMEALYWLAWESLRLAGRPVDEFDGWLSKLVTVDLGELSKFAPPPPGG